MEDPFRTVQVYNIEVLIDNIYIFRGENQNSVLKGEVPSIKSSRHSSPGGSSKGSEKRTPKGSKKGSGKGTPKGSKKGSPKGSKGSKKNSKGNSKGSKKNSKGSSKGSKKASKGSSKGSKKASKGSSKGSKKASKGSSKGSKKGSKKRSKKSSKHSSKKGSGKGSRKRTPTRELPYSFTGEEFKDKKGRTISVIKRKHPLPPIRANMNFFHFKDIIINQVDYEEIQSEEEETVSASESSESGSQSTSSSKSTTASSEILSKSSKSSHNSGPVNPKELTKALEDLQLGKLEDKKEMGKKNKKEKKRKKGKKDKKEKKEKKGRKEKKGKKGKKDGKKKKGKKRGEKRKKKKDKKVTIGSETTFEAKPLTWSIMSEVIFKRGVCIFFSSLPEDVISELMTNRLYIKLERWDGEGDASLVGAASLSLKEQLQEAIFKKVHEEKLGKVIKTILEEELEIRDICSKESENEIGVLQVFVSLSCFGDRIISRDVISEKGLYNVLSGPTIYRDFTKPKKPVFKMGPKEDMLPFFRYFRNEDIGRYITEMEKFEELENLQEKLLEEEEKEREMLGEEGEGVESEFTMISEGEDLGEETSEDFSVTPETLTGPFGEEGD